MSESEETRMTGPGRSRDEAAGDGTNGARRERGRGAGNGSSLASEQGRGIRDQIRRYRSSFIAILVIVGIGVVVGGYVLSQERLNLPAGFPVLGQSKFTLKAYFRSAQALTPGQGQAVTIAGAKIGEIEAVQLREGRALVTMGLTPKYARIYHDATLLVRPKTPLQEMTVEVNPGTPAAGRLKSGAVIGVAQTSPNVNFDQFLSALDGETRAYLQALLAGAAEGLKGNGANLAAAYKRFDPLARNVEEITRELQHYHANIARSIHNFSALMQALGEVEKQLSELVVSANRVFRVFASQDANVQRTLRLLPGALAKTQSGLGRLATAAHFLGPTLAALHPFARDLAPAQEASRPFLRKTTPIIANQVRPFAREAAPAIAKLGPASRAFAQALPGLTVGFSVVNEIFNELAYNPGSSAGGFLFFADWAAHNVNSSYSTADAHGALGNTMIYFRCNLLSIIEGSAKVDPAVKVLVGLLNLPKCATTPGAATTATARSASRTGGG
ncbi:MAG: MCE family protein, partial [Acidobacteriota bacterium]|nr:MCE family protein [Acidobacteriota bacterium]